MVTISTRPDRKTALMVDIALNLQASHGDAAAARALAEFQVPLPIALRVLNRMSVNRRPQSLAMVDEASWPAQQAIQP